MPRQARSEGWPTQHGWFIALYQYGLAVMEFAYPAGLDVHEHVHDGEDEMFYLLSGQLSVFCEEDSWTAGPGSFVFVPRGRRHGFTVTGTGPASALVITGPPRLDGQIAARAEPPPG